MQAGWRGLPRAGYGQTVLGALAEGTLRRPRASLALTLAALALATPVAIGAPEALPVLGSLGEEPETQPELVLVTRGQEPVRSPVYRTALEVISARIETDPLVREVKRGSIGTDRRTTALLVEFDRSVDSAEREDATERVIEAIDPGPLEVLATGVAPTGEEAREAAESDLGLELLAAPLSILILIIVAGWRFALVALVALATGLAVAVAALRLLGGTLELAAAGIVAASGVAMLCGIEAALAIRDRERLGATSLVAAVLEEAERLPVAAGIAALAGLTLLTVALPLSASFAISAALGATVAVVAALLAAPALASIAGGEEAASPQSARSDRWDRLARFALGRAPFAAGLLAIAVAIAVALAVPFAGSDPAPLDASALPADSLPAEGSALAETELRGEAIAAIDPARPTDLVPRLGIAGALVIVVIAGGCFALSRLPAASIALAVVSVIPAAVALGLLELVFGTGQLDSLLDYSPQDEPSASAAVIATGVLLSLGAFRSALAAPLLGSAGPSGAPDRARRARLVARDGLRSIVAASLVGVLAYGVLLGSDLLPAKELGLALAAGLVVDLALVRLVSVPALARLFG
jgi:hypothetical protein